VRFGDVQHHDLAPGGGDDAGDRGAGGAGPEYGDRLK
jgi:hypothetical protein